MNRIYKVIWNEALNCFTAVGEYAKARGKSSKSSVSANATINTTENLSSTSAFKITAIGLGLMAAGFTIPASADNGTLNHHDGDYSHSHGSHGVHSHTIGNNSHNNNSNSDESEDSISLKFEGDNATTITRTNGETLNILGGATGALTNGNIGVFGTGDTLTVQLAENVDLGTDGSLKIGDTLVDSSGITITNTNPATIVSLTSTGLNNGGNQITNVASGGETETNAANIGDIQTIASGLKTVVAAGTNVKNVTKSTVNGRDTYTVNANGATVAAATGSTAVEVSSTTDAATNLTNYKVDLTQASKDSLGKANNSVQYDNALTRDVVTLGGTGSVTPVKITNVKRGAELTDAVNVEQLNEVKQSATDANKGWNISAQGANISTVKPSDTVDLNNTDNNITVSKTAESNNVTFNLSNDIAVDSVQTGNATMNSSGLTIVGGPKLTKNSVDAGGNKITNVADGMAPRDAVNFSQLDAVSRNLGNSINELGYRIGEVEDDANAGISAAMAMSSLPQAYIIGKSMIGGGIATYNGESAVAIGFSKMSTDGRWVMKLNGTADTQGNVGAAIGAGFHFD